jgi:hypothetical protein
VLLRMWEGPQQAIVCPLARSDWDQVAYPVFEGPEGPGMIDLIGHTQPEPVSGKILN